MRGGKNRPKLAEVPKVPWEPSAAQKLPLQFLLECMNDSTLDMPERQRAAIAAAPFLHAKPGAAGKRESAQTRAAEAAKTGRLKTPPTPRLMLVRKD
jgi:hypothetical protein